jgi:hypothetical protein
MAVVPKNRGPRVAFYAARIAPWTGAATGIGTTSAAVTDLSTKTSTAQTKIAAAVAAQAMAKNATADADLAVREMSIAGAAIIQQIRAKAAIAGPGVYILAEIPAPATPTPVGDPGTPTAFKATLNPDGTLALAWACANPAGAVGTMYQVSRRHGGTGAFAPIGTSGRRKFVDASVPAGVAAVTYQVQAVRSTAAGPAAQFLVNFGVDGGGEAFASVAQGGAPKLAA